MLPVPAELQARFEECLRAQKIQENSRKYYQKWLRFYLDFCEKYRAEPTRRESLAAFLQKLRDKKQTDMQLQQASHTISLYFDLLQTNAGNKLSTPRPAPLPEKGKLADEVVLSTQCLGRPATPLANTAPEAPNPAHSPGAQSDTPRESPVPAKINDADKTRPLTGASWKAEYTGLVEEIRIRHYSPKTLKTYRLWLRQFQAFTRSKPPESLSTADVKEFLTWLAVKRQVAASTLFYGPVFPT